MYIKYFLFVVLLFGAPFLSYSQYLQISDNKHYLVTNKGKPFFWLADTGWELFHRLNYEEASLYLETRAKQGFNVIQAVALSELDGLTLANANGDLPLVNMDISKPNEKYFAFMDKVIQKAADLGMYIALLPTWGDKWCDLRDKEKVIFDSQNAFEFGKYMGNRYKDYWNIVWVLGGDRNPVTGNHYLIIRQMAKGLQAGDGGKHLISFHCTGYNTSASYFHNDDWLSFNMIQSGHGFFDKSSSTAYLLTMSNYMQQPPKPTLNSEPLYEDLPIQFWEKDMYNSQDAIKPFVVPDSATAFGYFTDYHARAVAYWSVFAGACGHTYGNGSVWCFWDYGKSAPIYQKYTWKDALNSPGALQMGYLRKLMEQYEFQNLIPDLSILPSMYSEALSGVEGIGKPENVLASRTGMKPEIQMVVALRDINSSFVIVYSPVGNHVYVSLAKLKSDKLTYRWFNPREGNFTEYVKIENNYLVCEFMPPVKGTDWILVIESRKN